MQPAPDHLLQAGSRRQHADTVSAGPAHLAEAGKQPQAANPQDKRVAEALEVRDAFTSFVGQTFFGQLIKSMRTMVDKPAYFHGGRAEEIFRSQLDQRLAEEMSDASADRFIGPMFRQQFPQLAEVLNDAGDSSAASQTESLSELTRLFRR